jgi:uroporphyrinogen decarboxylase
MASLSNGSRSPFLLACRREPVRFTPIWLMRQAGRYLPEYRRIRERLGFLELCRRSDLAAQVTVDAARRLGVDAAIIFADILLPLIPMGIPFHFESGDGPRIDAPVRTAVDLDRLEPHDVDELRFVAETIRLVRAELSEHLAVIGFAGAPFTLASYIVEGGASRDYVATKRLIYHDPGLWRGLMERVVAMTNAYVHMQIEAGADAIQLFDSWVGTLAPDDYRRFALPYVQQVIASIGGAVPVIYFGTMTAGLLEEIRACGADVIGVDWRIRLDEAWNRLGAGVAIQGNLDPALLFADLDDVRAAARDLLTSVRGRPGHIFNLGHGVLPETPVDSVLALVEAVHAFSVS